MCMGKRLGQHFLKSKKSINIIVNAINTKNSETIVEVGPGKGALTKYLIDKKSNIIAVEKDSNLINALKKKFSNAIKNKKILILQEDIRGDVWKNSITTKKYVVIANIPYYLTGSLIRNMLTSKFPPRAMALVIQKEVAERIIKRDNKESLLSLSVQFFGSPKYIQKISKREFLPPPKIDSALITITNIHTANETFKKIFFDMISIAFKEKRKTVLKKFNNKKKIQNLLVKNGINEKTRAEDIPFNIWNNVAQKIFADLKKE